MDDLDLTSAPWRKASASDHGEGCVEVAFLDGGHVAVRDSKNRHKEPHLFTPHEWTCFLDGAKRGEFDSSTT